MSDPCPLPLRPWSLGKVKGRVEQAVSERTYSVTEWQAVPNDQVTGSP